MSPVGINSTSSILEDCPHCESALISGEGGEQLWHTATAEGCAPEVLEFQPPRELTLDAKLNACEAPRRCFSRTTRLLKRGLEVCLDDQEALRLLQVAAGLHGGKNDSAAKTGRIRGIATGTVFRRLVAKTWARQFGTAVEAACAPFQFALSTRAGVDCVGYTM